MAENKNNLELEDLNEVMRVRRQKLQRLNELGVNPYPYNFKRTEYSKKILAEPNKYIGKEVSVSGRLMAIRGMGKAAFAHLLDSKGRIQIYVRKDQIGDENFEVFNLFDIGDIIGDYLASEQGGIHAFFHHIDGPHGQIA